MNDTKGPVRRSIPRRSNASRSSMSAASRPPRPSSPPISAARSRSAAGTATGPPAIADLVARLAGLGYIDDAAFATARAASLQRRGYGERRVNQALYAAGIADDDAVDARTQIEDGAWDAALRFAATQAARPLCRRVAGSAGAAKGVRGDDAGGPSDEHGAPFAWRRTGAIPGIRTVIKKLCRYSSLNTAAMIVL